MKVTVITPTKNSGEFISDCLDSVGAQDYPFIEHIIVDCCSTDCTASLVLNHPNSKSIRLYSGLDDGIYDAFNKGYSKSTGDIIFILNSDDVFESRDVISRAVSEFKSSDIDLVFGDILHVERDDIHKVVRFWRAGPYSRWRFRFGWLPPHTSCFYSSKLLQIYSYDSRLKVAGDIVLLWELFSCRTLKTCYLRKLIVRQRTGGMSTSGFRSIIYGNFECYHALKGSAFRRAFFVICKILRKFPQARIL